MSPIATGVPVHAPGIREGTPCLQTEQSFNRPSQDEHWVRITTFLQTGGKYAELSQEDQIRYQWVVSATVRIMENRFRQMQLGIISEDDLAAGGGAANTWWFRSEHFLDSWQSRDQTIRWNPEFLEFMETEILGLR
jgi:hypothetical protein